MAEEARIIIDAQLQFRHDTESNWLAADPILKVGEPAYTVGLSDRFKLGDGQRKWSELPYLQLNKSEGDEEAKGYTSLAWADIKNLTSGEETVLAQAFALKQAYQELKGIIPSLSDYYTKEEVNNLIPTVPDLSAYYTRGQVDQLLLQKASQSDFETLEEQVGELDGTVGQYSTAIANNASAIASLRSTVDGVSVGLDDLQESFNELDFIVSTIPTTYATIKALEDEAAARELWQTGINNRLGDVESDVETIWNDYVNRAELKKALEDLGVSGIATRLNAVEQAVGEFYGYLPGDIMEGDILATRTWVEGKNYAKSADLSAYLQKSFWDSIFEIKTTESGSTYISVKGGLVADWMTFGGEAENTGGGGQSYSQRNWLYIQTMTQDVAGDLASAYAVKQAYQELRSLASEVSFAQIQTSGTLIGVITIDGVAQNIYAPASASAVDWSAITGKPSFAAVATSGSYNDLSNKPTIPTIPSTYAWTAITGKPTTLSGYGITDKVAYRETWNNFIHNVDEFTFVSPTYSGYVWLNYRTASGGSDGAITEYRFARGAGESYAALRASSYVVNGGTSSQFLKADGSLDSTAYLPTSGGTMTGDIVLPDNKFIRHNASDGYALIGVGNNEVLVGATINPLRLRSNGISTINGNTIIHSGNIGSYAPIYNSTGNVGIGTTTPAYKLDVAGALRISGTLAGMYAGAGSLIVKDNYNIGVLMMDANDIQAKASDEVTPAKLWINGWGGGIGMSAEGYNTVIKGRVDIGEESTDTYFRLQVTGACISRLSSGSADAMFYGARTDIGRQIGLGIGTSNNRGIYDANLGWVFKITTSDVIELGAGYTVNVPGTIHSSTGIWTEGFCSFSDLSSTSDRRYKKDIKAISTEEALRVIKALKPCTWEWNERAAVKGESAGFIAQEVMPILPTAIKTLGEGDSEHLTLNYQMLHGYEVTVLQNHDDELTRLRGRLEKADRRIDFLEQEVKRLRSRAS